MIKSLLIAACLITTRTYWNVNLVTYAAVGSVHTHVVVTGYVAYAVCESDGDIHIKIVPTIGATSPFIIAECIPSLPCVKPATSAQVRVSGISRRDAEHSWYEVHPVEKLEVLP